MSHSKRLPSWATTPMASLLSLVRCKNLSPLDDKPSSHRGSDALGQSRVHKASQVELIQVPVRSRVASAVRRYLNLRPAALPVSSLSATPALACLLAPSHAYTTFTCTSTRPVPRSHCIRGSHLAQDIRHGSGYVRSKTCDTGCRATLKNPSCVVDAEVDNHQAP
jgi:hypothetical protein